MSALTIAAELLAVALVTTWLLNKYSLPSNPYLYQLFVFFAWWLGFSGTVLLPSDVANSVVLEEEYSYFGRLSSENYILLWQILYWSTFTLAWILLPIMMEFYASGYFNFIPKLLDSLKVNMKFYIYVGVPLILGGVILVFAAGFTVEYILNVVSMIGIIYGMCLLMVFLGYGLASIPRKLWRESNPKLVMNRLYVRAGRIEDKLDMAEKNFFSVLIDVAKLLKDLEPFKQDPQFSQYIIRVLAKCPDDLMFEAWSEAEHVPYARTTSISELKRQLCQVHGDLNKATIQLRRYRFQWNRLTKKAIEIQNILNGVTPEDYKRTAFSRSLWRYKCYARPITNKFFSICCWLLGFLVIWCESTISVAKHAQVSYSPLGMLIDWSESAVLDHIISVGILAYMSVAVYRSLFRVALPGVQVYSLHTGKLSDVYALCFNAMYLCRLQFSLGWNYLETLHKPELYSSSGLYAVLGPIDTFPVIGTLNIVMPIICGIIFITTVFKVFSRLMAVCGLDTGEPPEPGTPLYEDCLSKGKVIVHKAIETFEQEKGEKQRGGSLDTLGIEIRSSAIPRVVNKKTSSNTSDSHV